LHRRVAVAVLRELERIAAPDADPVLVVEDVAEADVP
jgi:hypothetical protein